MPKLIRLNKYGTLGISIPKAIVDATDLKAGDNIEMKIKQTNPDVIIALRRPKPIWG